MADYQYLTDQDKADIVAQVMAARPSPESVARELEAAHYRSMIEAKLGLHDAPDPYEPPDVSKEAAEKDVLDREAAKLPTPTPRDDVTAVGVKNG